MSADIDVVGHREYHLRTQDDLPCAPQCADSMTPAAPADLLALTLAPARDAWTAADEPVWKSRSGSLLY